MCAVLHDWHTFLVAEGNNMEMTVITTKVDYAMADFFQKYCADIRVPAGGQAYQRLRKELKRSMLNG